MGGGMGGGNMMAFGFLAMVLGLLVFAAIVLLSVWAGSQLWRRSAARPITEVSRAEDPMSILQRRYAGGEVSQEDYERIRRELQSTKR